jgi:hypothetical protein
MANLVFSLNRASFLTEFSPEQRVDIVEKASKLFTPETSNGEKTSIITALAKIAYANIGEAVNLTKDLIAPLPDKKLWAGHILNDLRGIYRDRSKYDSPSKQAFLPVERRHSIPLSLKEKRFKQEWFSLVPFVKALHPLITSDMTPNDQIAILNATLVFDLPNWLDCTEKVRPLITHSMRGWDIGPLLKRLGQIRKEERLGAVEQVRLLIEPSMSGEDVICIMDAFPFMRQRPWVYAEMFWGDTTAQILPRITPETSVEERVTMIIEAASAIEEEQRLKVSDSGRAARIGSVIDRLNRAMASVRSGQVLNL